MNIFSFYADVPEINSVEEMRLSVLWRQRWTSAGFEPVILGEWHAQQHPLYPKLMAAVENRPTINAQKYEIACFQRWLALAVAGGGYMSDMDVIARPGEFGVALPEMTGAQLGRLQIYQSRGVCPSLVFAMRNACAQLAEVFIEGKLGRRDQNGRAHWSDQYTLEDLAIAKSDWIELHDFVRCYSDEGWETAQTVHFANSYMKGHHPRWQAIPKLLPA